MKKYYGVVATTKKVSQMVRSQNEKGHWISSMEEANVPIDVLVISDQPDRMAAMQDIEDKAAKLGKLKVGPKQFG